MFSIACVAFFLVISSIESADPYTAAKVCSRDFRKIGCFVRDLRLVPDLLITDLDVTHENFSTHIDWANYGSSLHSLACRCREKAYGKYKYFGIGMYGECVAGNENKALENLFNNPDKAPFSCINGENDNCKVSDTKECSGTADFDFFYEIIKGDCSSQIASGEVLSLFEQPTLLTKNNKVTVIPELGKLYDLSVEVKPTGFISGWASILHLTISGNAAAYGDRAPGLWFYPSSKSAKTNKIYIANAINGDLKYYVYSPQVPLNQWIKIRLNQIHENSKFVYRVYVNDEMIKEVVNRYPETFYNVSVYAGDPWYNAQPGHVRNFKMAASCLDITEDKPNELFVPKETVIVKNTQLGIIHQLCNEYSVSLEVKPTAYVSGWGSVLHASQGGNWYYYGDRVPGIWFYPSKPSAKTNKLLVCGPLNKNSNKCYPSESFPLNEWIKVEAKQERLGADYIYRVNINGKEIAKVVNNYPATFYGVKVFSGDPWYTAQPGSIRNVKVVGRCYDAGQVTKEIAVPTEKPLVKNTELGSLTVLCKEYVVSFDVKPTSFSADWASVIHLSAGSNWGIYGDRVPGIWFHPSSLSAATDKLTICGAVSGNSNWCHYTTEMFPKNKWISVKVMQIKKGDEYFYSIHINGKEVAKVKNTHPANFYGVKVWAADPWYAAQKGSIRNIYVHSNCQNEKFGANKAVFPKETKITKGTELQTLTVLCKQYSVSFDVKVNNFGTGWKSVLHLTKGGNWQRYGDRIPGVWFYPSTASALTDKLTICGPVNKNSNWCHYTEMLPKNKWISVKVMQVKVEDDYYYSILIDGKEVRKVKNTYPADIYGVKIYSGDPWYEPLDGHIRNINVDGGSCLSNA